MKIKELLNKNPLVLTDEELKYIGKYFLKHPDKLKPKPKVVLHKCINCKHILWWDGVGGKWYWKCFKDPEEKEMTTMMITHKRKCDFFIENKQFGTFIVNI